MEDPSGPKASIEAGAKAAPEVKGDDTPTRSWVVPIATALALASAFCLYYFVYVGARREYLVNRNFRSLAALGDQLQRILSTVVLANSDQIDKLGVAVPPSIPWRASFFGSLRPCFLFPSQPSGA